VATGAILGTGPMRILIVEDEALIAAFVARALRAEGYATQVVADGDQAIELLDHPWDLIVLDLLLPGQDGFAVLHAVAERGLDVPVLVLSARSRVHTKVAAFDAGASDYLAKPFSVDELLARVRARLVPGGRTARTVVRAQIGVEIDHERQIILDGGRRVALSERELAVFEYLLRSADEIVSRERLLSAVWQYGFDPRSNVVDVCVGRLRRKLESPVAIESVRGAGYRLTLAQTG
jgi:two-component system, OmpR family, copper resistance phosphate regulon response regulator CusR